MQHINHPINVHHPFAKLWDTDGVKRGNLSKLHHSVSTPELPSSFQDLAQPELHQPETQSANISLSLSLVHGHNLKCHCCNCDHRHIACRSDLDVGCFSTSQHNYLTASEGSLDPRRSLMLFWLLDDWHLHCGVWDEEVVKVWECARSCCPTMCRSDVGSTRSCLFTSAEIWWQSGFTRQQGFAEKVRDRTCSKNLHGRALRYIDSMCSESFGKCWHRVNSHCKVCELGEPLVNTVLH